MAGIVRFKVNKYVHGRMSKDVVIKQAESIWKTLDIYHRLKNVQPTYGLWEKK